MKNSGGSRAREPVSLLQQPPYGTWPMQDEVNRKWNRLTPVLEMLEMKCHEWVMLESMRGAI